MGRLIHALRPIAMKHIYWLLLILLVSSSALAQTGSLRGQVTDQNGGGVPGAKVTINGPSGLVKTRDTDKSGSYSFAGLPAEDYEGRAAGKSSSMDSAVGSFRPKNQFARSASIRILSRLSMTSSALAALKSSP